MNSEQVAQAVANAIDLDESGPLAITDEPDEEVRSGGFWFEVEDPQGEKYAVLVYQPGFS